MIITPSEVSAKNSRIEGISLSMFGTWEDVTDVTVAGKPKKRPGSPVAGGEESPGEGSPDEDSQGLQVGDTIRIKPFICDQYDNVVGARADSLKAVLEGMRGKEEIPILTQYVRGVPIHEAMYELQGKGRFRLDVFIDDTPIAGSPIEFTVKPRSAVAPPKGAAPAAAGPAEVS